MARIYLHNGRILEVDNDGFKDFFSNAIEKNYTWLNIFTKDGTQVMLRLRMVDYIEVED